MAVASTTAAFAMSRRRLLVSSSTYCFAGRWPLTTPTSLEWWSTKSVLPTATYLLLPRHRTFAASSAQEKQVNDREHAHRHAGIQLHPNSIGCKILPGNKVNRTTRSGHVQTRYTELVHGYFWMLKDLRNTDEKPILSNTAALIDEKVAQVFPVLPGVSHSLSGQRVGDFPAHLLRKNRSRDAAAQCTLVAVSFRDFGFQQLSSWIDPFKSAFSQQDRVEVLTLNVAEGWLNKFFLRPIITAFTKRNTDAQEHDRTFLYFGDTETFRDALRMHNVLAGYVFLLDGVGRVRFAGSGVASEQEVARLIQMTKELTPLLQQQQHSLKQRKFGSGGNANRQRSSSATNRNSRPSSGRSSR